MYRATLAPEVLTKSAFASLVGVTPSRVSQWLAGKKLSGAAIAGTGVRARIRVGVALEQLKQTLDVDQRLSGNARARLDSMPQGRPADIIAPDAPEGVPAPLLCEGSPIEEHIKHERFRQIALSNIKARQEQAARSGRYILAADARQEMGRIAGRMATMFESSLVELSSAIASKTTLSPRDVLLTLRAAWRDIRARQAKELTAEAAGMPATVEEGDISP